MSHCHWLVLLTEVKLTPPEMINRNAKHILVIKNNFHLDRSGCFTLEEDQDPGDEASEEVKGRFTKMWHWMEY